MIYEVIPMLERLEHSMTRVRNATQEPNIVRVAAEAALLMIGKYYALTDENEVYRIAIGRFFSLSDFGHGLMSYLKQCAPKKRSNGLIRILIGVQRIELRHDGLFKNDGKNHI